MLSADQIDLQTNDIARDMVFLQHPSENLHRRFKLFGNHLIGAKAIETLDLGNISSADQNLDVGAQAARLRHRASGRGRIRDGNHQHAGPADANLLEDISPGSIAEIDRYSRRLTGAN